MKNITFPGIVTAIFAILLPFFYSSDLFYPAVSAKHFWTIGLVTILALYLVYVLFNEKAELSIKRRWLLLGLAIWIGSLYLASFFGVFFERSLWSDIIRSTGVIFLTYVAVLSYITSELFTMGDWKIVRRAVVLSGAIFAFFTMLGPDGGLDLVGRFLTVNFQTSGLTLGNSTFAGAFLFLTFVITMVELIRSETTKEKIFFYVALIVQFLSPVLFSIQGLLTKGTFGFLGSARASSATIVLSVVFVGGLFLLQRFLPSKKIVWIWNSLWLLGITALVSLLFVSGSFVQNAYVEQSTAARIIIWGDALNAVAERPLLGWGPENFSLAIEKYADNRLYLDENFGEIWFDRAHNIFIDTLVSVGVLGTIIFSTLGLYLLFVFFKAAQAGLIKGIEANVFGVLVVGHVLQMQTSFDVVTTYIILGFVMGYALWLEKQMVQKSVLQRSAKQALAGVLLLLTLIGGYVFLGEYSRQRALFGIFQSKSNDNQIILIEKALSRQSDFEGLRLSSASLINGLLEQVALTQGDAQKRALANGLKQLTVYEGYYEAYTQNNPEHLRARMNYVYVLLTETVLGNPRLNEAKQVIEDSYSLAPQNPLTPALDSIVRLYSGDTAGAQMKIDEALALNPSIPLTQEVANYIEEQIQNFPVIKSTYQLESFIRGSLSVRLIHCA